jgi:hypothetical protein
MLSNTAGIHLTVEYAKYVYTETAYWIAFNMPSDKINLLHIKTLMRVNSLELDVLFSILSQDKRLELNRKKQKAAEKEKEEIQAEEAVVRSLLMEN